MSYSKFSEATARYISNELKLDRERQVMVAYSIEILLLTILGFALILLAGAALGAALQAGVAAIAGGGLRRLSGGAHFDTPVKCLAFGTAVYSLIGVFSRTFAAVFSVSSACIPILFVSLVITGIYAPVDSKAKPLKSRRLKIILKSSSIAFVAASILAVVYLPEETVRMAIVLGVLYQSLTLLPIFNRRR